MKKKILSFVAVFTLACSLLSGISTSVQAESLYIRKIVSIVYDDSGSMLHDGCANWAYANYALQSFCGVLNSDDRLFVTYMTEAEDDPFMNPPEVSLDASSVQASVDTIRKHDVYGNTPYDAVEIAFNKLSSVSDSNPNTQYWLVVITDGEFQSDTEDITPGFLRDRLDAFANTRMQNGSTPQITYLAIGENASKPLQSSNGNVFIYSSAGAQDIVDVMAQIADKISGRVRVPASNVKKSGNSIEITSDVPLLNIAVLVQKSEATIESASVSGKNLQIAKSAKISYPEHKGWVTDTSLNGSAYLINNGKDNISPGSYKIDFDSSFELENIVVMYEPALELRLSVSVNDKNITDLSELKDTHCDDLVDVTCKIYEVGTDNEISADIISKDVTYSIAVKENDKIVKSDSSSSMTISDYKLSSVSTEFSASVCIDGFSPINVTSGEFTPLEPIPPVTYTLGVEKTGEMNYTVAELKNNNEKVLFTIYADGVPITKEEAENANFKVETVMPGKTQIETDGKISFTPMYQNPITSIPTGNIVVKGILNNDIFEEAQLYIKPLEYGICCETKEKEPIERTSLSENEKGVKFGLYVDGDKVDKEAVEAADIQYKLDSTYAKKLKLYTNVEDDGTIVVVPKYDKWWWLSAYRIPTGTLSITAGWNGTEATDSLEITKDLQKEIFYNVVIPLIGLLIVLGEVIKPRFRYSYKIHSNYGTSTGSSVSGPKSGWESDNLFTLSAIIPFVPDFKRVKGLTFWAKGKCFIGRECISLNVKRLSESSGVLNDGLSDVNAVRFRKNEVDEFIEGEKKHYIMPGQSVIIASDHAYSNCQVYLYSET